MPKNENATMSETPVAQAGATPETPVVVDTRPLIAVKIDATIPPSQVLSIANLVTESANVVFVIDLRQPLAWLDALNYVWQHAARLRLACADKAIGTAGSMLEPELPKCQVLDSPRDADGKIDVAALTSLLAGSLKSAASKPEAKPTPGGTSSAADGGGPATAADGGESHDGKPVVVDSPIPQSSQSNVSSQPANQVAAKSKSK